MSDVFRSHELSMARGEAGIDMRHEAVRPGRVSMHWLRYGAPVTMTAPEMDRFYLFQFILDGACEIRHRGRVAAVGSGQSYVVHPCEPLTKTWNSDCRQLIVRVDRDRFEAFAARELGIDIDGGLDFAFDIRPLAAGPRGIVEIAEALRGDAAEGRNCMTHSRVADHLDTTILSLLLASFPHRHTELYDRAGGACGPYYVGRAEEYMRAHWREPISIGELAEAAGVSVRSLFAGFRRFRGVAPMAWLKAWRLDRAAEQLRCADPAEASVTAIALACGFTHLSRFAQDYQARFGERPSLTLGRSFSARRQDVSARDGRGRA